MMRAPTATHVHPDATPWGTPPGGVWGALRWKPLLTPEAVGSKEFLFGLAELDAGQRLPLRRHAQARIDWILSGRLAASVDGRRVELEPGDCVYCPGGAAHDARALGGEAATWVSTYACELIGHEVASRPLATAGSARLSYDPWVHWRSTEPWRPVEPVKGLRLRLKRVMDRERPVELIAGVAEIDPPTHYTRHWHDQAEIYYITRGSGIVYAGDDAFEVGPGSCLYIPARMVHGADSLGTEPLTIFYVYGCETAGHVINWTPVEEIYTEIRRKG